MTEEAPNLNRLVELLEASAVRGLGEADLLTRKEVRRALRCSWAECDRILSHVPAVTTGRWPLYRWGRVLRVVEVEPTSVPQAPARPAHQRPRVKV